MVLKASINARYAVNFLVKPTSILILYLYVVLSLNVLDKHKYKLHYIYREFTADFFKMDLHELPPNAINFKYKKFNAYIMGLCLTYHVNLKLSTRQAFQALQEIHGIKISHTMIANYAMTIAAIIKPFTDTFDYKPTNILSADETYIKVKGIHHYVWIIMYACKKSILAYQVSDTRAVGPCILAMRMAFKKFKTFPNKTLKYSLRTVMVPILLPANNVNLKKVGILMLLRSSGG
jgi:hypothetical protein